MHLFDHSCKNVAVFAILFYFLCKGELVLFVLVIGMLGVQLQINHESLPKERKILSECEARGQNLVLLVMTSD